MEEVISLEIEQIGDGAIAAAKLRDGDLHISISRPRRRDCGKFLEDEKKQRGATFVWPA